MSTAAAPAPGSQAAPLPASRPARFWSATVGKKAVMAVTGVILFGFVIGHMLGNLQFFLPADYINNYAEKLQSLGPFLWLIRLSLLVIFFFHVVNTIALVRENRAALLALGLVLGSHHLSPFTGHVIPAADLDALIRAYKGSTLRQRDDWPSCAGARPKRTNGCQYLWLRPSRCCRNSHRPIRMRRDHSLSRTQNG